MRYYLYLYQESDDCSSVGLLLDSLFCFTGSPVWIFSQDHVVITMVTSILYWDM